MYPLRKRKKKWRKKISVKKAAASSITTYDILGNNVSVTNNKIINGKSILQELTPEERQRYKDYV